MTFIERLNSSMNLLCFLLIVIGGLLAIHNPHTGEMMMTLGGGAFGGAAIARAAANSNPNPNA